MDRVEALDGPLEVMICPREASSVRRAARFTVSPNTSPPLSTTGP
jgi:hypothetical protein